jgi:hypothetical protein
VTAIVYGTMYIRIVSAAAIQTGTIVRHVKHLQPDMPEHITKPLRHKKYMFITLTVSLALAMVCEAIVQGIVLFQGHIQTMLLVYELSNIIFTFIIGLLFHPTEYSPFFFMEPVTEGDGDGLIVATLVKPVEDVNIASDVEVASLIGSRMIESMWRDTVDVDAPSSRMTEMLRVPRSRLVVVHSPKDHISLGISTSDEPSSSLHPTMVEGGGRAVTTEFESSRRGGGRSIHVTIRP